VEDIMMEDFKVFYDEKRTSFSWVRRQEEEVVEIPA
jgi:hypothetical protein